MEKDKIFFGESGLTSTSANFIANVAKELYQQMESELDNICFYTTTVKLIGNSDISVLSEGKEDISSVKDTLQKIATLKSLIAWLREGIKAKESLVKEIENSTCKDYGIKTPEEYPEREATITEDDVISSWNIKQRNRYYYLETLCSQIGGYIHPKGTFAEERKMLHKIIAEPNRVEGNGRDTLLYSRKPTISADTVEETFLDLQQTYRGYQAELNAMKYEIQTVIEQDGIQKAAKYQAECQEYKDAVTLSSAMLETAKKQALANLHNQKIIIPDSLKPIYEMVSKAGKK